MKLRGLPWLWFARHGNFGKDPNCKLELPIVLSLQVVRSETNDLLLNITSSEVVEIGFAYRKATVFIVGHKDFIVIITVACLARLRFPSFVEKGTRKKIECSVAFLACLPYCNSSCMLATAYSVTKLASTFFQRLTCISSRQPIFLANSEILGNLPRRQPKQLLCIRRNRILVTSWDLGSFSGYYKTQRAQIE